MIDAERRKHEENSRALAKVALSWLENVVSNREEDSAKDEKLAWASARMFGVTRRLLLFFQIFLIIIFGVCGGTGQTAVFDSLLAPGSGTEGYNMFIGVEIMM
jgi:hypothetical protein